MLYMCMFGKSQINDVLINVGDWDRFSGIEAVHENQILHNLMLVACVDSLLFILHPHEVVGVCFVFGFFSESRQSTGWHHH